SNRGCDNCVWAHEAILVARWNDDGGARRGRIAGVRRSVFTATEVLRREDTSACQRSRQSVHRQVDTRERSPGCIRLDDRDAAHFMSHRLMGMASGDHINEAGGELTRSLDHFGHLISPRAISCAKV